MTTLCNSQLFKKETYDSLSCSRLVGVSWCRKLWVSRCQFYFCHCDKSCHHVPFLGYGARSLQWFKIRNQNAPPLCPKENTIFFYSRYKCALITTDLNWQLDALFEHFKECYLFFFVCTWCNFYEVYISIWNQKTAQGWQPDFISIPSAPFSVKKNNQNVHKESLRNQHYDPQSCCAVQLLYLCEFLVEGVWGKIPETGATAIIWANIPHL